MIFPVIFVFYKEMEFKVTNKFDAAIWLSKSDSLPLELWHNVTSFLVEKRLKYYILDDMVIYDAPGKFSMMPLKKFRNKKLLPLMQRKTIGDKQKVSTISFDLLYRRKTMQEVLSSIEQDV